MSFFWPTEANPNAGFSIALGRLLHWASVAFALFFAWVLTHVNGTFYAPALVPAVLAALVISSIGRGLRYLFAQE
jgi:hypothetical protein